jgi:hypothetical protein
MVAGGAPRGIGPMREWLPLLAGSAWSSVFGTIDRVTGATTVHTTTWVTDKIVGSNIIRGLSYYLVCKATS